MHVVKPFYKSLQQINMNRIIREGFLYFYSDTFDTNIRQLASPTKVAFAVGFTSGIIVGFSLRETVPYVWSVQRRSVTANAMITGGNAYPRELDIPIQRLDGTFQQKIEEILDFLAGYFADDNVRLNRLKRFLQCPDENTENDLAGLMRNVSRALMPDCSEKLQTANFFSKVVELFKSETDIEQATLGQLGTKVNELVRLCFEKDILLINADEDSEYAQSIETDVNEWNFTIDLESDVGHGQTTLSSLYNAFDKYMFVFVIVTQNLAKDNLKKFLCDGHLLESLCEKKGRLIPVKIEGMVYNDAVYRGIIPWKYNKEKKDESKKALNNIMQERRQTMFPSTGSSVSGLGRSSEETVD